MIIKSDNPFLCYEEKISQLLSHTDLCQQLSVSDIHYGDRSWPIRLLQFGDANEEAPVLAFVAGVHGLEAIGVEVLLNFLTSLTTKAGWHQPFNTLLSDIRLLVIPVLNPFGIEANRRSNGNGIDLMRNAPIDAIDPATPLVGGHRITSWLPWFRGDPGVLEQESKVLYRWCHQFILNSPISVVVDIHSGFGSTDQIWYPWAGRSEDFPYTKQVRSLETLFNVTYPHHHHYSFSRQSKHYITHGDLWDWIFIEHQQSRTNPFIPLTLEMGSWLWMKKNPRQILNRAGLFHPMVEHRHSRVLRQHLLFFYFLTMAVSNWQRWFF